MLCVEVAGRTMPWRHVFQCRVLLETRRRQPFGEKGARVGTPCLRYEPGAGFPLHKHDFAQVWYIIEGEFRMGDKTYGPGTLVYMEDPHYENEMRTETGGTVLFVQYPGPTTGARPIYDGRMNLTSAPAPETLDLEH